MNKVLLYFIVVSVVLIGCNRVYHDEDNLIDRQLTPLRSDQIVEFKVISIKPRLIGGEIELKRLADKYNTHNFAGKVEVEYIADRYGRTRDLIIVNEDSLDVETINAVKLIIQNLKYQAGRDKNLVSQNVKMKQNLYFENYDTDENTNSADQVKEVTKPNKETVIKKLERPEPIGEKEIDEFVKKAFDIYDSTNSASNRIRNIDQKIQELLQIQNIVGNPIAMIKKEAKLIENSVKSLKTQSEELIGLSQNVLKSATKVKFTKIASATRNIKSSIEAVTASAELLLKLVADIPEILKKIAEF